MPRCRIMAVSANFKYTSQTVSPLRSWKAIRAPSYFGKVLPSPSANTTTTVATEMPCADLVSNDRTCISDEGTYSYTCHALRAHSIKHHTYARHRINREKLFPLTESYLFWLSHPHTLPSRSYKRPEKPNMHFEFSFSISITQAPALQQNKRLSTERAIMHQDRPFVFFLRRQKMHIWFYPILGIPSRLSKRG